MTVTLTVSATRLTWRSLKANGAEAPESTLTVRSVTRSTGRAAVAAAVGMITPGGVTITITIVEEEEAAEASEVWASRAHQRTRGRETVELRFGTTGSVREPRGSIPACQDTLLLN